ncbi:uncharacterized protein LOC144114920 isoform X2 [Amblyomma americanum]
MSLQSRQASLLACTSRQQELQRRLEKIHEEKDTIVNTLEQMVKGVDLLVAHVCSLTNVDRLFYGVVDASAAMEQLYLKLFRIHLLLTTENNYVDAAQQRAPQVAITFPGSTDANEDGDSQVAVIDGNESQRSFQSSPQRTSEASPPHLSLCDELLGYASAPSLLHLKHQNLPDVLATDRAVCRTVSSLKTLPIVYARKTPALPESEHLIPGIEACATGVSATLKQQPSAEPTSITGFDHGDGCFYKQENDLDKSAEVGSCAVQPNIPFTAPHSVQSQDSQTGAAGCGTSVSSPPPPERVYYSSTLVPSTSGAGQDSSKLVHHEIPTFSPDIMNSTQNVVLSFYKNPAEFWLQLDTSAKELEVFLRKLHEHYSCSARRQGFTARPGMSCAAFYAEDGHWYRAKIVRVFPDHVTVYYVDFGNTDSVDLNSLCILDQQFATLPAQALYCGIKGLSVPCGTGAFSLEAVRSFRERISAQNVKLQAFFHTRDFSTRYHVDIMARPLEDTVMNLSQEFLASCVKERSPLLCTSEDTENLFNQEASRSKAASSSAAPSSAAPPPAGMHSKPPGAPPAGAPAASMTGPGMASAGMAPAAMAPAGMTTPVSAPTITASAGRAEAVMTVPVFTAALMAPPGMAAPGFIPAGMAAPCLTPAVMTAPGFTPAGMAVPGLTGAGLAPPGLTGACVAPPGLTAAGMAPPGLNPAGMVAPGLTAAGMVAHGLTAAGMAPPRPAGMATPGMNPAGMVAPGLTAAGMMAPGLTAAGMAAPGLTAAGMAAPGLTPAGMAVPCLTPAGMAVPGLTPAGMAVPGLTPAGMAVPGLTPAGMAVPGLTPAGLAVPGWTPAGMVAPVSTTAGRAVPNLTPAGTAAPGSTPVGTAAPGSTPVGTAAPGSTPVGTAELGSTPVGTAEPGSTPVGTAEPGSTPVGTAEPGSTPVGTAEPGSTPVGTAEPGSSPFGTAEPGSTPFRTAEPGSTPFGTAEPGSTPFGTAEPGSTPFGTAEPGSTPFGTAEPGTTPAGMAVLNTNTSGMAPPGLTVPNNTIPGLAVYGLATPSLTAALAACGTPSPSSLGQEISAQQMALSQITQIEMGSSGIKAPVASFPFPVGLLPPVIVPPAILPEGDSFSVILSVVFNPTDFYGQVVDNVNTTSKVLEQLQQHLNMHGIQTQAPAEESVAKGSFWMCLFEGDKNWYRVQVLDIIRTAGGRRFRLLYVDYGNRTTVTSTCLRPLPYSLSGLPACAYRMALALIAPKNGRKWDPVATGIFVQETGFKAMLIAEKKGFRHCGYTTPNLAKCYRRLSTLGTHCKKRLNVDAATSTTVWVTRGGAPTVFSRSSASSKTSSMSCCGTKTGSQQ